MIECISADGTALPPLIIFKGETLSTTWISDKTPPDWQFSNSIKGWTSMELGDQWMKKVYEPFTRDKAAGRTRLLICDGHDSHISVKFIRHSIDNMIIILLLPPHSSHLMQPLDVGVFSPLKSAMTKHVNRLLSTGIHRLQKVEWLECYIKAREEALIKRNILAGWRGAGLFPRNVQRILRQLPDFTEETQSSSPPTTPSIKIPLFLSSSPPEPMVLHEQNVALSGIVEQSVLDTPTKISIRRSIGFSEQLQAANTILTKQNQELRDTISARKERLSGKRLVLKGKFIVSTEEVYEQLSAAISAAEKPKPKKNKNQTEPAVDTREDSPSCPEIIFDAIEVMFGEEREGN